MIVTFSAFSLGTSTFVPSLKRAKRLLLLRPATPATGRSGTGAKKLFTILNKFLTILMISPVRLKEKRGCDSLYRYSGFGLRGNPPKSGFPFLFSIKILS